MAAVSKRPQHPSLQEMPRHASSPCVRHARQAPNGLAVAPAVLRLGLRRHRGPGREVATRDGASMAAPYLRPTLPTTENVGELFVRSRPARQPRRHRPCLVKQYSNAAPLPTSAPYCNVFCSTACMRRSSQPLEGDVRPVRCRVRRASANGARVGRSGGEHHVLSSLKSRGYPRDRQGPQTGRGAARRCVLGSGLPPGHRTLPGACGARRPVTTLCRRRGGIRRFRHPGLGPNWRPGAVAAARSPLPTRALLSLAGKVSLPG